MVDVKVRIKEGCRGGREQFTWNSIKQEDFKDRESYLGASTKVGQMGKFGKYYLHDWYARSRDTTESIGEERESVQAYEEELMQEALGLKPKKLLLAKQQMGEDEMKAFLKSKKGDIGREAMGPQKKVVTNEFGEQVAASNEDFFAEAVRDKGSIKGLGFATHRDAKLEKIKAQTMGTEGELKGSKLNDNLKSEMKLEYVKLEAKVEVKTEPEAGAQGSSPSGSKREREEVKEEDVDQPPTKRRAEEDSKPEKKDKKAAKKEKKLKKAEKKLRKMEKKAAKKEKKAAKEAKLLQKAAEEARRKGASSSSSDSGS
mmetsp:Transcript_11562/g.20478  ORF Transcript_11562/g.20478 Transcript_11562/m.20478 type:complete len:314 (-) Transcript_11562:65-1006(-)